MKYEINMDTIVLDPNDVLRTKCEEVPFPLADSDRETVLKMLEYVKASQDDALAEAHNLQPAVGIAAPQIGIAKRMTAIYLEHEDKNGNLKTYELGLINPRVISHSEKLIALPNGEGCLSIRDEHLGFVPRYQRIRIKAFDVVSNQEITLMLSNYPAIVLQHELDHLNGILFYDRINHDDPWSDQDIQILE